MAINKRAKNIRINIKDTYTTNCGRLEIIAKSITITSTKEDLVLASGKKIVIEGKNGGVKFGEYIPLPSNILSVKWMDETQEKEVDNIEINQTVFLYVETRDKKAGTDICITINTSNNSEITLKGTTEEDGIAKMKWVYV